MVFRMRSFDLTYDADEDVLEITFAPYDEQVARTIPLNDNILLYTDLGLTQAWGISLFSFGKLLAVSETELTGLRDFTEAQRGLVLRVLSREPSSLFINLTYPDALIARVCAPNVRSLIQAGVETT